MIVVIGGTSGIGLETAIYIKNLGYKVVVCGRKKPNKKNLKYQLLDVSNESHIKSFFRKLNGPLNGIVYAAGITLKKKPITSFSSKLFDQIMKTNATGLLLCLKYSYKKLAKSKGKIVVVNSLASRISSKYSGVEYTMSKSALSGLVRQLAIDFAKDKVLINSVLPGMVKTPMLMKNNNKTKINKMAREIPLKRIGNPLEVSKAIAFLLLNDNTYMTGCSIDINGGQYING